MALLIQYLRKGCAVVAKNCMRLLCKIKVVIFQLMINTPEVTPTIDVLNGLIFPKYSGAKNNEWAPNVFIKLPPTVAKRIYQKRRNIW